MTFATNGIRTDENNGFADKVFQGFSLTFRSRRAIICGQAGVLELADEEDSKSFGLITRAGSTPATGTNDSAAALVAVPFFDFGCVDRTRRICRAEQGKYQTAAIRYGSPFRFFGRQQRVAAPAPRRTPPPALVSINVLSRPPRGVAPLLLLISRDRPAVFDERSKANTKLPPTDTASLFAFSGGNSG